MTSGSHLRVLASSTKTFGFGFRQCIAGWMLCCFWLTAQAAPATCVKTVRWYDDSPYSFRSADGQLRGLYVDLVKAALKGMQCEARFVEMPWARALVELKAGRLDILPGALHTAERETYAHFSRPLNRSPNVLFTSVIAAQRFKPATLTELVGTKFRLGAQIGVSYGAEYDAALKIPGFRQQITEVTSRKGAWKMLALDRIDGIIADEVSALTELQELKLSTIVVKTAVVVSDQPSMLAISKASQTLKFVAALNGQINSMISSGEYRRIRDKYVACNTVAEQVRCQ